MSNGDAEHGLERGFPVPGTRPGSDIDHVTNDIVGTWRALEAALSPIIGRGGVGALFRRSAHLAARHSPWLAPAGEGIAGAIDVDAFRVLLLRQTSAQARTGGDEMLKTFHELLVNLVGYSLTKQLVHSVWQPPPAERPDQDIQS